MAKYNTIGIGYNETRKADPYLFSRMWELLSAEKGKTYLDVGCGTGNYTNEFQKRGIEFIGIDPSEEMLVKARERNINIDWRKGTAENSGLDDNSVHGVLITLTIHHWTDINKAFAEIKRVKIDRAPMVIFTTLPEQTERYWLNDYFPIMLKDSIDQLTNLKEFELAMKSAGMEIIETEKYSVQPDLQDKFLYCGKHNPEMYFDETIRKGISSFSSLANKEEVDAGLAQLRADIDSGMINSIIQKYDNDLGDYTFIKAV